MYATDTMKKPGRGLFLITGVETHWSKGVLLTGVGAALMGEGDGWQRGRRALIGCGGAGAVILGLIATLK